MRATRILAVLAVFSFLLISGCQEDQGRLTAPPTGGQSVSKANYDGPPLSGAIFTTTFDGSIVNENVRYDKKEDVYLDGGPGQNAPAGAAALPAGDYYFQVTDPSGQDLLSTDHISCRRIHINAYGVIDIIYAGLNYEYDNKDKVWTSFPCKHEEGTDTDHAELGAKTVQLYPYDNTPNRGGVYKVWVTPVDAYDNPYELVGKQDPVNGENYQPGNYHGFIPRYSKTDNYKVKGGPPPCVTSELTVRKFHDANANGVQDEGEADVAEWGVTVTDPLGVPFPLFTPVAFPAPVSGDYTVEENTPENTVQTAAYLDGVALAVDPTVVVTFASECEETHEVVYGNVGVGSATACKYYDANANGVVDEGEVGIAGYHFDLYAMDEFGVYQLVASGTTGDDGCVTFSNLMPGDYKIVENMPSGTDWHAIGATEHEFTVVSILEGAVISGSEFTFEFTNVCYGEADFDTKGYWHNKNGLVELSFDPDITYVNGLAPYSSASDYFGAGDEPFDGYFANGTPVAASNGVLGDEIAPAGSWQAEVSQFLVDANAGGDPREQCAQQLLAFIFNVQHRLDSFDAVIEMPDGSLVAAGDLIADAIAAWESGDAGAMASLLDGFNNNDAVRFVYSTPCDVSY